MWTNLSRVKIDSGSCCSPFVCCPRVWAHKSKWNEGP